MNVICAASEELCGRAWAELPPGADFARIAIEKVRWPRGCDADLRYLLMSGLSLRKDIRIIAHHLFPPDKPQSSLPINFMMVDWISLAVPFAYLGVLVGSLATFSSLYRKRKACKLSCRAHQDCLFSSCTASNKTPPNREVLTNFHSQVCFSRTMV